jgi:hypothetical protein
VRMPGSKRAAPHSSSSCCCIAADDHPAAVIVRLYAVANISPSVQLNST